MIDFGSQAAALLAGALPALQPVPNLLGFRSVLPQVLP